ncbi:hypothetical protein HMN09_00439600 [Mycena chlorophos]|uniref:Uncharacterized protein n=1 Tax=Mycena chlorophos TaxID=658473 RepID=A0A8H6TJV9_MYCCL|nr:hypothetical protein HMN09_00439600 [Mycena chlorophos]
MILLLPDLKFFSGALGKAIVSAIETKPRYGFPTEANDTAHTEFERSAARQVTLAKNTLKTKIKVSIKKKTPVAQLANELIASFGKGLEHTLAFHQHIALIRMHIEKGHSGHSFWEKIDADLDELYAAPAGGLCRLAYILDKEKYPSRSSAESYPFGNDASQKLDAGSKAIGPELRSARVGDRDDSDDDEEEEEEQQTEPAGTEGDWDDEEQQPPGNEEHNNSNTEATPRTPGSLES